MVSVYLHGEEAATKQRVVLPGSWDDFLGLLREKLRIASIASVTDAAGAFGGSVQRARFLWLAARHHADSHILFVRAHLSLFLCRSSD